MNDVIIRRVSPASEDRLIQAISFTLKVPASHIHPYTHLRDDLHLDAVDILLLIAKLENRFHVYLTPEEVESIETVRDAAGFFFQRTAVA